MWYTEQLWVTVDFHGILQWKSKVPQNSLVTNFLKYIFLYVCQNKEIHTGTEYYYYYYHTTWGGLNDNNIIICGWTLPLSQYCHRWTKRLQFFDKQKLLIYHFTKITTNIPKKIIIKKHKLLNKKLYVLYLLNTL